MEKQKSFLETVTGKRTLFLVMIPVIALLNYIGVKVAIFLKIPFFLDTWATSLGVMAFGLPVGLAGGVLYNLYMGFFIWTENPYGWIWALVNIWVALSVYSLFKLGWINIKKPGKLLVSAIVVGLSSAVVIVMILFTFWGGVETYEGVLPTYDALLEATGSKTVAAIGEKFITTPIDQIVSIFLAAIIYSSLPRKLVLTRN